MLEPTIPSMGPVPNGRMTRKPGIERTVLLAHDETGKAVHFSRAPLQRRQCRILTPASCLPGEGRGLPSRVARWSRDANYSF